MFSASTYQGRRSRLASDLGQGLILIAGNIDAAMNYRGNPYPFRQDSTFLYFGGPDKPGLAMTIDPATGRSTLYGDDLTLEDIVWVGAQPTLTEQARQAGFVEVRPMSKLSGDVQSAGDRLHYLPPYRGDSILRLATWTGRTVEKIQSGFSEALIHAVIGQRSIKSREEIEEMTWAVDLTGRMHVAVMREAEEGLHESDLASLVTGMCEAEEVVPAYGIILSKDGQTLHNHHHGNTLESGQLVLGDFGAESRMHYAGDITRTFPVDRHFTNKQREVYEVVLDAEMLAIEACKPGVAYRDIHLHAARIIANGLKDIGLMKGDCHEAVAAGAHALFFPHGLGHMIGLDVHDMEDLGENFVGYDNTVQRSDQFGLAYLRLARKLQPGFVLTVEPGIYFIPELIDQWKAEKKHADFINYSALEKYRTFGGIRIEDNVLITEKGYQILGDPIPKAVAEVEALRYIV
ncbi:MAG: aminopeptidase P family protein [Saprospiraceae bacterium]|nr:aminopeptidase P family protein [Saprospiraceae bacterium]